MPSPAPTFHSTAPVFKFKILDTKKSVRLNKRPVGRPLGSVCKIKIKKKIVDLAKKRGRKPKIILADRRSMVKTDRLFASNIEKSSAQLIDHPHLAVDEVDDHKKYYLNEIDDAKEIHFDKKGCRRGADSGFAEGITPETYLIDRYKYAVRHIKQGLSVEEACNKYRISKGALLKCLSGGTAPRGKKTRLNEKEENLIVEWLIENKNIKYNEAIHMVFEKVAKIFEKSNKPNPFSNGKPSMDWWYDFLSRHPQIMASKRDWLMRGKVNDQYMKDVQSGKLKCTKFRRALLSAIQYIKTLNDQAKNEKPNARPSDTHKKPNKVVNCGAARLSAYTNKRHVKQQQPQPQSKPESTSITAFVDWKPQDQQKFKECKPVVNDDDSLSCLDTRLNGSANNDASAVQANVIPTPNKNILLKIKSGSQLQQHLIVSDNDDDDYDDLDEDINFFRDSIDPSAFLP
jgi:hypothetical protein